MPTVKNSTKKEICVRIGRNSVDYNFYFIPAQGSIEVGKKEAKAIVKRVKETKTTGISVSKHLPKPLSEPKKKEEAEGSASVEIN